MNNQNKTNVFENIADIIFYVLLIPVIFVLIILGIVLGSAYLVIYAVYKLITWPFSAIKERKKKRIIEAQQQVPDLIEPIDLEDCTNE